MSKCSVDMHVLSTLWLMRVGRKCDARLSKSVYGNRLERGGVGSSEFGQRRLFKHYWSPYERWQTDSLDAIKNEINSGGNVTVVTADIKSFYHNIPPNLLASSKHPLLVAHAGADEPLSRLMGAALEAWSTRVSNVIGADRGVGLPIGVGVSDLLANAALFELDDIAEISGVVHYGRYVDDIIIVIQDALLKEQDPWAYLVENLAGGLYLDAKGFAHYKPSWGDWEVSFTNEKNRVYRLGGASGLSMVEGLVRNLSERASQVQSVPLIGDSAALELGYDRILNYSGSPALKLREVESVSTRRQLLSHRVAAYESYAQLLPAAAWGDARERFINSLILRVLDPETLFEQWPVIPRVLAASAAAGDINRIGDVLSALNRVFDRLRDNGDLKISGIEFPDDASPQSQNEPLWDKFLADIDSILKEAVAQGGMRPGGPTLLERRGASIHLNLLSARVDVTALHEESIVLASRDLGFFPFKDLFPKWAGEYLGQSHRAERVKMIPEKWWSWGEAALRLICPAGSYTASHSQALLFSTRPFDIGEVRLAADCEDFDNAVKSVGEDGGWLANFFSIAWGYFDSSLLGAYIPREGINILSSGARPDGQVRIALSHAIFNDEFVTDVLTGSPNLSPERYKKIGLLINATLAMRKRPEFLILPELYLPRAWFGEFSKKLRMRGVGLISGVEYAPRVMNSGEVENQAWISIPNSSFRYFSPFNFKVDKMHVAPREAETLRQQRPAVSLWKPVRSRPTVFELDGFNFSVLICYDLTDISLREQVRGMVDALIALEFNKDTVTFDSLVTSASIDLHAYVIQVNARNFGDARVRVPARNSFERDVVRISGGETDVVLAATLNVDDLRAAQRQMLSGSPSGVVSSPAPSRQPMQFKQLPAGFQDRGRRLS